MGFVFTNEVAYGRIRDHHLNRGYERLVEKFNALGADIKKA